MSDVDVKVKTNIAVNVDAKEPPLFNVVFLNDDTTTIDFVVEMLMIHFDYDANSGVDKAREIHEQGSAVVATLPYELAEQKGVEITMTARKSGYPLQIRISADQ